MRGLIILCLVAVAFAAPQYQYQQGGDVPAESAPQGSSAGVPQAAAGPLVYNKQYYIHSAPEDALDGDSSDSSSTLANKRNLRVVIIKSPENRGLENAALQLAKAAGEDRTAIYVLNKQTDLGELQSKLAQITDTAGNKPEVHFVKYRTPQEAAHAQQSIQSQYDSLQGPTSVSNEGVAPVRSFIGSLGQSSAPAYNVASAVGSRTQNGYLPPVPAYIRRY